MDFLPKLIEEKKFSSVSKNFTMFVEEHNDGNLEGIYIKEKLGNDNYKIIVSNKGKLIQSNNSYSFKLFNGSITNINEGGSYNIGFKETDYKLSEINSKTRKTKKLSETKSIYLIECLKKFLENRKAINLRCGTKSDFLLKDIYEEVFKRIINPIYIIVLSLISSLIILKSKITFFQNYFKFFLFIIGFVIILMSELTYKLIEYPFYFEIISITLPILAIFMFYLFILVKSKFNLKYL